MITQSRLKELLSYDPLTGLFVRRVNKARAKIGDVTGWVHVRGYIYISVDSRSYKAHRLAFLYMLGYFPEHGVDHKNRDPTDNRWENLRHSTQACNTQNTRIRKDNKAGLPGVSKGQYGKWVAQMQVGKRKMSLGHHESRLEAALAKFTCEVWHENWTCNYQGELVKAIKLIWPGFAPKN